MSVADILGLVTIRSLHTHECIRVALVLVVGRRTSGTLSSCVGSGGCVTAILCAERSGTVNSGGNSCVETGAVLSDDGSVEVENVDTAPSALFGSSDTRVAIRVFHASIIDNLRCISFEFDFLCDGSLCGFAHGSGNSFENIEFTMIARNTFGEHKHGSRSHGSIERTRHRIANTTQSPCENFNLGQINDSVETTVDTSRIGNKPEFVVDSTNNTLCPHFSGWINDNSGILGDLSLPFSLYVTLGNLETTVVAKSENRSNVGRLSANFVTIGFRNTSVLCLNASRSWLSGVASVARSLWGRRSTSALASGRSSSGTSGGASSGGCVTLEFAISLVSSVARLNFVALVSGAVALVSGRETLGQTIGKRNTSAGRSRRNALESVATKISVTLVVLEVDWTSPWFVSRRRTSWISWFASATRSSRTVVVNYGH